MISNHLVLQPQTFNASKWRKITSFDSLSIIIDRDKSEGKYYTIKPYYPIRENTLPYMIHHYSEQINNYFNVKNITHPKNLEEYLRKNQPFAFINANIMPYFQNRHNTLKDYKDYIQFNLSIKYIFPDEQNQKIFDTVICSIHGYSEFEYNQHQRQYDLRDPNPMKYKFDPKYIEFIEFPKLTINHERFEIIE